VKFQSTLFDVVLVVQDLAQSDREVVAVLWHLLRTRRIRFARPLCIA
jgi:hypothetical protein